MKNAKRILLVFLTLSLFMLALQAGALAEEEVTVVSDAGQLLEAVNDPGVTNIRLDASFDATGSGVVNVSGKIIDLGGNTISADNFTLIFEGTNFTLKNGAFDSKGGSYALFIGDEGETDNVIIEGITADGGINVFNATNVVLRDVNVTGTDYYAVWCDENGHVSIESGEFTTNGNAVLGLMLTDSELNINGGNFITNGKPLVLLGSYGTPVISGGQFDTEVNEEYFAEGAELISNPEGGYFVCDHSNTETRNAQAATCVSKGYTGEVYCADCGKKLSDGEELPMLDHDLEAVEGKAPTCVSKGFEAYWVCSVCNQMFSDAQGKNAISEPAAISPTGEHDYVDGICSMCGRKDPALSDPSGTGDSLVGWMVIVLAAGAAGLTAVQSKKKSRR